MKPSFFYFVILTAMFFFGTTCEVDAIRINEPNEPKKEEKNENPLGPFGNCLDTNSRPLKYVPGNYNEALEYSRQRKDVCAWKIFYRLAENGDPRAQRQVADILEGGNRGMQRNHELALKWHQKAAAQGY